MTEKMKIERLDKEPMNGEPEAYITVYESIGGWNSVLMEWQEDYGFYEPWQTGMNNTSYGTGEYEGALREAEMWAWADELPLWIERKT